MRYIANCSQIYLLKVIIFFFFFQLTFSINEAFPKDAQIDWKILKAATIEEIMPFFDTENAYQIAVGITLLSKISPVEGAELLLEAWEQKNNNKIITNTDLLDDPTIKIALAASLERTKAYPDKEKDFENYIYSQISSSDDYVKGSAIVELSSFKNIGAANKLLQISKEEPNFLLNAVRGLCNIYHNPGSDKQAREIAKTRLTEISEGQYPSKDINENAKHYIEDEVMTCLDYSLNNKN